MSESNIEWTEHVWNPIRGCSRVSPGCAKCYAERDAARKDKNPKLSKYKGFAIFNERHEPHWTGKVELIPEMLDVPWNRKKPTTYFVNSMSDLFHEALAPEDILVVFLTMQACPQHTFQVLTKRSEVMQRFFIWERKSRAVRGLKELNWPLSNVWLGVSVEDRERKYRIDQLRQAPAAIRFLSLEPLLEDLGTLDLSLIDWVICGGESGPGARRCDMAWIRSIVDQCKAAGVACFVKQLGSHIRASNGTAFGWPINTSPGLWSDCSVDPPRIHVISSKGGVISEWPEWARVREMPERRA